jgi:small nuclear ribonucleoprotein (snRNP)-like protein
MSFQKRYHHPRRRHADHMERTPDAEELVHPESTGTEASYLKSLIESHRKVTVKLKDGEQIQGYIRYYDHDCFSVGLLKENKKIFIRKSSVSFISEN